MNVQRLGTQSIEADALALRPYVAGPVFHPVIGGNRYVVLNAVDKSSNAGEELTLSTSYIPKNAKAVSVQLQVKGDPGWAYLGNETSGDDRYLLGQNVLSASIYNCVGGVVPTYTDGTNAKLYILYNAGGGTVTIWLGIIGYFA